MILWKLTIYNSIVWISRSAISLDVVKVGCYRPTWPTSGEIAERDIQTTELYIFNFHKITSVLHENKYMKMNFVLIPPLCQIKKKGFTAKAHHAIIWGQHPAYKSMKNIFQPGRCATKVRNSNIINALPLMIFFFWHSKRSQIHHKWSFCLIMFFFISIKTLFSWRASVKNPPSFPPLKCIQNETQTLLINFSKQVKQHL